MENTSRTCQNMHALVTYVLSGIFTLGFCLRDLRFMRASQVVYGDDDGSFAVDRALDVDVDVSHIRDGHDVVRFVQRHLAIDGDAIDRVVLR